MSLGWGGIIASAVGGFVEGGAKAAYDDILQREKDEALRLRDEYLSKMRMTEASAGRKEEHSYREQSAVSADARAQARTEAEAVAKLKRDTDPANVKALAEAQNQGLQATAPVKAQLDRDAKNAEALAAASPERLKAARAVHGATDTTDYRLRALTRESTQLDIDRKKAEGKWSVSDVKLFDSYTTEAKAAAVELQGLIKAGTASPEEIASSRQRVIDLSGEARAIADKYKTDADRAADEKRKSDKGDAEEQKRADLWKTVDQAEAKRRLLANNTPANRAETEKQFGKQALQDILAGAPPKKEASTPSGEKAPYKAPEDSRASRMLEARAQAKAESERSKAAASADAERAAQTAISSGDKAEAMRVQSMPGYGSMDAATRAKIYKLVNG